MPTTSTDDSPCPHPSPGAQVHKLPRQSLSSYLKTIDAADNKISSRIETIDTITRGGLSRGKVTEIAGPPGSGKTSFAIQFVVSAVLEHKKVLWIDTASCVPLARILAALPTEYTQDPALLDRYVKHLQLSSLPHLLIFVMRPPEYLKDFDLVIIDDIATPLLAGFAFFVAKPASRTPVEANGRVSRAEDHGTKRARAAAELVSSISRLAAQHNSAVLLLSKMVSRIVKGQRARLVSVLGEEGDGGSAATTAASIWTRICLFRNDILLEVDEASSTQGTQSTSSSSLSRKRRYVIRGVPHACAVKCANVTYQNASLSVFRIVETGIANTDQWFETYASVEASQKRVAEVSSLLGASPKRKIARRFDEGTGTSKDIASCGFLSAKGRPATEEETQQRDNEARNDPQDSFHEMENLSEESIPTSQAETLLEAETSLNSSILQTDIKSREVPDSEDEDGADWSEIDVADLLS
ncbi:P-loop containing nucleoside triphosphate hydrolase protein [Myxozyma melibiosi]|uniref:P-loop containing nucleoside triphosphate hydrolase protein n=1 Tax=Myxozyma melibiosi TaxID=54550 RepID=A0ABR1FBR4_9ASCO